ncbi:MFS transporter [Caulobacter sp. SLTY]|uniref:MFS transporter n=1 Tax=Caulobacter sp. SLTY TaxID=2683262 RepID=UPI001411B2FD|nr:MFS transporter [Caulobacter sp. SLTY]NBB14250.1 MFS transporter [Caulobacter sp. SLTY]
MPPLRSLPLVLVLGLGQMVAFASSFYLLGVLGDPIARDLGVSSGRVFGLLSMAFLISAVAGPWVGRWLDETGGRVVLLVSSGVFAASLVMLAAARDVVTLTVGMALLGVGMAIGLYSTAYKILVGQYGEGARPMISAVALLGGLGGALGWPITLAMEGVLGWRGACLAWAGMHLLVCLPLAARVTPRPLPLAPHAAPPAPVVVRWDRRMVQLAILFAGTWCLATSMAAHLPRLLEAFGLPRGTAVATAALAGSAGVAMRFLEMTVLRRFSPLLTARLATLLQPAGAGLLLALGPRGGVVLSLGQGMGNGLLSVASGTLPLSLFGPEGYARRSALMQTPARLLQVAGPAAFAAVLAWSPAGAVGAMIAVGLIMFAATFGLERRADAA